MTKKIIIDSVDVSGCEYFDNPDGWCKDNETEFGCGVCEDIQRYYYKQLQRTTVQYNTVVEQNKSLQTELKQKENEIAHQKTLTETYRACYLAKYEDLAKELENKKQECEGLKERLNEVLCDVDTKECEHRMFCGEPIGYGCQIYENHSCNDNDFLNCNFRQKQRLKQENICYKQAIDEIEKIVTPVECPDVDRKISFGSVCHSRILDIINKADFGKSETRLGESFVEKVEPPIIQEAKEVNNENT